MADEIKTPCCPVCGNQPRREYSPVFPGVFHYACCKGIDLSGDVLGYGADEVWRDCVARHVLKMQSDAFVQLLPLLQEITDQWESDIPSTVQDWQRQSMTKAIEMLEKLRLPIVAR